MKLLLIILIIAILSQYVNAGGVCDFNYSSLPNMTIINKETFFKIPFDQCNATNEGMYLNQCYQSDGKLLKPYNSVDALSYVPFINTGYIYFQGLTTYTTYPINKEWITGYGDPNECQSTDTYYESNTWITSAQITFRNTTEPSWGSPVFKLQNPNATYPYIEVLMQDNITKYYLKLIYQYNETDTYNYSTSELPLNSTSTNATYEFYINDTKLFLTEQLNSSAFNFVFSSNNTNYSNTTNFNGYILTQSLCGGVNEYKKVYQTSRTFDRPEIYEPFYGDVNKSRANVSLVTALHESSKRTFLYANLSINNTDIIHIKNLTGHLQIISADNGYIIDIYEYVLLYLTGKRCSIPNVITADSDIIINMNTLKITVNSIEYDCDPTDWLPNGLYPNMTFKITSPYTIILYSALPEMTSFSGFYVLHNATNLISKTGLSQTSIINSLKNSDEYYALDLTSGLQNYTIKCGEELYNKFNESNQSRVYYSNMTEYLNVTVKECSGIISSDIYLIDTNFGSYYHNANTSTIYPAYYSNPTNIQKIWTPYNSTWNFSIHDLNNPLGDEDFNTTINYSMNAVNLTRRCRYLNLSLSSSTDYVLVNGEKTSLLTSSTYLRNLTDLAYGLNKIYFKNTVDANFYQVFEFKNDYYTSIIQNISIIKNDTITVWIRVLDVTKVPRAGALLRVYQSNSTATYTNYSLIDQLYTDDDGYASFETVPTLYTKVEVSLDGYSMQSAFYNLIFYSNTKTDAYTIVMLYESNNTPLYMPYGRVSIEDKTQPFYYYLIANNDLGTITYQTDYSIAHSGTPWSAQYKAIINGSSTMAYVMTLTPEIHFTRDNSSITLYIYQNSNLIHTVSIPYIPVVIEDKYQAPETHTRIFLIISFIIVTIISVILQLTLKSSTGAIGMHTLAISSMILAPFHIAYVYITAIFIFHYSANFLVKIFFN